MGPLTRALLVDALVNPRTPFFLFELCSIADAWSSQFIANPPRVLCFFSRAWTREEPLRTCHLPGYQRRAAVISEIMLGAPRPRNFMDRNRRPPLESAACLQRSGYLAPLSHALLLRSRVFEY